MESTRRQFLKGTLATTTACGLAQLSAADDTRAQSITDTHVYLGHWPHQQLSSEAPSKLVADLRRAGVTQAWAGSFDGLFHKDIAGVNQRLADTCAQVAAGMLLPFGTINPTLPDWEDDIRRCHETFHMPGVRLHPTYHGYMLDNPRFAKLLDLAAARGLIVQLVASMESKPHFVLNPHVPQLETKPLKEKVAAFPRLKLVVANGYRMTEDEETRSLLPLKPIHFDFSRAETAKDVRQLIETTSTDRVVFGSCMPLHDIDPVISKMQQAQLTDANHQAIAMENANRLVATDRVH
jgi:predicted TIM-barrel fold metal-dependent hydrolase